MGTPFFFFNQDIMQLPPTIVMSNNGNPFFLHHIEFRPSYVAKQSRVSRSTVVFLFSAPEEQIQGNATFASPTPMTYIFEHIEKNLAAVHRLMESK